MPPESPPQTPPVANPAAQSPPQFSPGYANYVLGVLFIVYVFNFVDRQVMSVFIGPIKAEFGASDTAMGLLVGFAFTLLYTFAGIPIARLADRSSRRNIIAIGLAAWSAMTVACGFARTFAQLVIARIGVGIGEAAGSPPSHSLIADYFPPGRRATALAIYASGAFVGSGLAYLFGGYLRELFDWRTAFIIVGLPGLLFALVVRLSVREPPRGWSEQRHDHDERTSLGETLRFLAGSRSWLLMMTGFSLLSLTGYAVLMWGYEFFGRVHGLPPIEIGQWMGLIVGLGGCLGTVLGGRLTDRLARNDPVASVRWPVYVTLTGLPLGALFLSLDSSAASLLCFAPFFVLLNVYVPALYSSNQALARLPMRATAAALMLFLTNIVGAGFGPLLVGALSDLFAARHGAESIRYALLCAIAVGLAGALTLLAATSSLVPDLERAKTDRD